MRSFDVGVPRLSYHEGGIHQGRIQALRAPNALVVCYEYDAASRMTAIRCVAAFRRTFTYDGQGRLSAVAHVPARSWKKRQGWMNTGGVQIR